MKIMTILGTRPEIIRLSRLIPRLDEHSQHLLVHTGQNFDARLSDVFFHELGVRAPNISLGIRADSAAAQIGKILATTEQLLSQHKPDRLMILGDTNSGLSAIIAKRMGIPVYHSEAGNRCFDNRVPEEINRRLIDQCSDLLMPYTHHSRTYLLEEGYDPSRIHVTGNPITEVLNHYMPQIEASKVLAELKLKKGGYMLVTLHRAENVDEPERLGMFMRALEKVAQQHALPMIISTHPRLRHRLQGYHSPSKHLMFALPFGFFDFIKLQENAACVLTDSGTVQEESCLLGVPCVTLRRTTERPETLEVGSNVLAGESEEEIVSAVDYACRKMGKHAIPGDYQVIDVSERILNLLLA